jgi:hypothetical protein
MTTTTSSGRPLTRILATAALVGIYLLGTVGMSGLALTVSSTPASCTRDGTRSAAAARTDSSLSAHQRAWFRCLLDLFSRHVAAWLMSAR